MTFEANVQYNDFTGTVACDRSDQLALKDVLLKQSLIGQDEHVMGFRLSSSGLDGQPRIEVLDSRDMDKHGHRCVRCDYADRG